MTYQEIFAKAKELIMQCDASVVEGHLAVQINIEGEGEGIFYIEIKDGALNVEPYNYYDNDCVLIATAENLIKLSAGEMDAVIAYTTGKLKIEGSVEKALEFKKILDSGKKAAKAAAKAAKKTAPKEKKAAAPKKKAAPKAKAEEKAEVKAEVKAEPKAEVKAEPKTEAKTAPKKTASKAKTAKASK